MEEVEEVFVPSDDSYSSGEKENRRPKRTMDNRKNGYRRPNTRNGVMMTVELDRNLLGAMKEICGERSVYWGIREACYQFVEGNRENANAVSDEQNEKY